MSKEQKEHIGGDLASDYTASKELKPCHSEAEAIAAWNRRYVKKCTWSLGDAEFGLYNTECGQAFNLECGTPKDNTMNFCCYCGGELIEKTEADNDS